MRSTIKYLCSFKLFQLKRPLCCLAFYFPFSLLCSVFKVQSLILRLELNTQNLSLEYLILSLRLFGGPEWARTTDLTIISRTL